MQASDRWPLIWFLAIFPIIVLGVFGWLVSKHHQKLYGPGDYKSDDAFLQTISPESQRQRLEKEIAELEPSSEKMGSDKMPSSKSMKEDDLVKEDVFRGQNVNRLRAEVVLAEDLVFRQLEAEFGVSIRRHSSVGRYGGATITLDGFIFEKEKARGIEVKLFREQSVRKNLANTLRDITHLANDFATILKMPDISFLFVVVSADLQPETRTLVESRFTEVVQDISIPIELRFYDLNELKQRYVGA